jgi:hypothetical protein
MKARIALAFVAAAVWITSASPAQAWPSTLRQPILRDARRLLPRSLAAVMSRREPAINEAADRLPNEITEAVADDLMTGRVGPGTITVVSRELDAILVLLRTRHVGEGLVRLGALGRVAADMCDPALTPGASTWPPQLSPEYYAFVEAQLPEIPLVLQDEGMLQLRRHELPSRWQVMLDESRARAADLPAAMVQGGRVVSYRTLDFRSPAFSVASLSYSRAVTSVAALWLVVWREARGDFGRQKSPHLIVPRDRGLQQGTRPSPGLRWQ